MKVPDCFEMQSGILLQCHNERGLQQPAIPERYN